MRRVPSFFVASMLASQTHSLASTSNLGLKLPATFPPLILASKSPTRQLLLRELGFQDLTIVPANLDERAIGDRLKDKPEALVLAIANAKADFIHAKLSGADESVNVEVPQGAFLLAGDQVVVHKNRILEKPADAAEAAAFMASYATAPCRTVGAVVMVELSTGRKVSGVHTAEVFFKTIPDKVVAAMLEEGDCLQCAGGLMIEHPLVQEYIDRVDGSIDSVMGLSKELVLDLMCQLQP